MKKLFLLIVASLAFVSCSNSLESKARQQMKETVLEIAKNPESVKIDNIEVVISNDSLCVLSFVARGQNSFGGYSMSNYEYYYVKSTKDGEVEFMEALNEMDEDEKGIINETKELIIDLADIHNEEPDLSNEAINTKVYHLARLTCLASKYGRKVKE